MKSIKIIAASVLAFLSFSSFAGMLTDSEENPVYIYARRTHDDIIISVIKENKHDSCVIRPESVFFNNPIHEAQDGSGKQILSLAIFEYNHAENQSCANERLVEISLQKYINNIEKNYSVSDYNYMQIYLQAFTPGDYDAKINRIDIDIAQLTKNNKLFYKSKFENSPDLSSPPSEESTLMDIILYSFISYFMKNLI